MQPCIEQTIQTIETKISQLTLLVTSLRSLEAPLSEPPAGRAGSPLPAAPEPAAARNFGTAVHPDVDARSAPILRLVSKLPNPFSLNDLCRASGMSKKAAWAATNRLAVKGWLEKTGCAQYSRTATFPTFGSASAPASTAPARAAKSKSDRASGIKSHPETLRICQVVATLPEPFNAPQIVSHARIDHKQASNFLTQGKLKGWLSSTSHGFYSRTKSFPTLPGSSFLAPAPAAPTPSAVKPSGPKRSRSVIHKELDDAIKGRDYTRANNSGMSDIYQKDVDRLTAELEASPH